MLEICDDDGKIAGKGWSTGYGTGKNKYTGRIHIDRRDTSWKGSRPFPLVTPIRAGREASPVSSRKRPVAGRSQCDARISAVC